MQTSYAQKPAEVAIIAWNGMDLTDFTAPVEVLSHARNPDGELLYRTTIVADTETSQASQGVSIVRHIDTPSFLKSPSEYDVLIVPGGGGFTADKVPEAPGLVAALEAFKELPSQPNRSRSIMSICAGSFFLAQAGILKGKSATGHPFFLAELGKLCDRNGGSNVVRQHYVDAGTIATGTRIITSGGITSGFDSTLYMVEQQQGIECAEKARAIMDADWRREALPAGFA